jgi:hypothetical protein
LTNQNIYDIAEWLAFNRDEIIESVGGFSSLGDLKNAVAIMAVAHFSQHTQEEIMDAFEDEKVITIFNFYFAKKRRQGEHTH